VFDSSASNIFAAPVSLMQLSVFSEYIMKATTLLQVRKSEARDVFDLSASANWIAPSLPILLPVLSENETKQQVCYF
jgi:hypothetical protein